MGLDHPKQPPGLLLLLFQMCQLDKLMGQQLWGLHAVLSPWTREPLLHTGEKESSSAGQQCPTPKS